MAFLVFLYLLIAAAFIVLDYFIAKWFFEAAEEKGYHDKKYNAYRLNSARYKM